MKDCTILKIKNADVSFRANAGAVHVIWEVR